MMSVTGLNYSKFAPLVNTTCLNTTTIDLSNATTLNIDLKNELGITFDLFEDDPAQQLLDYNNVIVFCLVLFGLVTNSSFLLTVLKASSLHTTTYILLSCLACSDLTILITRLVSIWINELINFSAFVVISCFHTFCCLLSTGFVILVSEERYLAICHPLTHLKLKGTKKRTLKLIGFVFLVSAVLSCTYIPTFFRYETPWCIIWPIEDLSQDYPQQLLVLSEYTWYSYYIISLNLFIVMLYILILASCVYMYANIW